MAIRRKKGPRPVRRNADTSLQQARRNYASDANEENLVRLWKEELRAGVFPSPTRRQIIGGQDWQRTIWMIPQKLLLVADSPLYTGGRHTYSGYYVIGGGVDSEHYLDEPRIVPTAGEAEKLVRKRLKEFVDAY